ncbi:hypothetical protein E1I18_02785 [Mycoplasmopsis mucosicanis]|uniref:Uncharacterized protein n=1 Tax=Mycoplasmopsis mucosicanis TaxID=458208 RepID=A0A507SPU4_9BACT|nr:hypothetical protein [Mycoplasmopsis mucosicanis]TQC51378.1 hypothetical protein E1I18_02785 [Mycoplasmopsis mucosicanis]
MLRNSHKITEDPFNLLNSDYELLIKIKEDVYKEIETEQLIGGKKINSLKEEIEEAKKQIQTTNVTLDTLWKTRLNLLDRSSLQQNANNISVQEKNLNRLMDTVRTKQNVIRRKMERVISDFNKHQNLFAKIKEVAIKLSEVDQKTNPELYKNIIEVLRVNRYTGSDDTPEINKKIENLSKIINNIESSKQAKAALNKLIELKQNQFKQDNNDHAPRTILAQVDIQIQEVIDANTKILNDENSTEADLKRAKNALEIAYTRFHDQKQTIVNKFNEVKTNFETEINKLLEIQKSQKFSTFKEDDATNGSHLQKLKLHYDALASTTKNGAQSSAFDKLTVEQIEELQKTLTLTHNKDAFNDKKAKLEEKHKQISNKIANDSTFAIQGSDGQSPFDKIKTLIDSISEDVNSKTKASQNSEVIRQTDKLQAIDSLLSKQEEIIDKAKKPETNQETKDVLVNILKESSPVADNVTPNSVNPTSTNIQSKLDEISEKFNNSLSFSEVKENSKKSAKNIKEQFNSSFNIGGDEVDAKSKEHIDNLIKHYEDEIEKIVPKDTNDSNVAKAKVNEVERKLQTIKNNITNIIEYSKEIKKADVAASKAVTEGPIKSVLETLKNELNAQITASQNSYTEFNKYEDHKEKINQIIARIDEIKSLNISMTTLTEALKTLQYKPGTAQNDESASKKTQFENFDNKLIEFVAQPNINGDILQIKLLSQVVTLGVKLIDKHKEILKGYDLGSFMFDNQKFGYELDQKILAQSTLDTVPTLPSQFDGNELSSKLNALITQASTLSKAAHALHDKRKEAFETINNEYTTQTTKLQAKQAVKAIYDELIKDKNTYFKEKIDAVSKFASNNDLDKIDEISAEIGVVSGLFDEYVKLTEKIAEAKTVKTDTEKLQNRTQNLNDTLSNIQSTIDSIEKTNAATTADNFFYNEKNASTIINKVTDLATSIAKVGLLVQHAEKTTKLNNSQTITGDARKILQKILDELVKEINGLGKASEDKIDTIKNKFIQGGKLSFESLYASSEKLIDVINLAEQFVPNDSHSDYLSKESPEMQAFYKDLQEKIKLAKDLLNNEANALRPDLKNQRDAVLQAINNSTSGLIVKLKSNTARDVVALQSEIDSIDTFINENFNETKKPTKGEFTNLELRKLKDLNFANINAIKDAHEKVLKAKEQIQAQKQAIVEFAKRRLKVMKQRLESFVKLAKGEQISIDNKNIKLTDEQSKKLQAFSGIDKTKLDAYDASLASVDALTDKSFDINTYIDDSRALRNKYNQLHTQYAEFKDIAKTNIILLNDQVSDFVTQLQSNNSGSPLNLFSYIDAIDKKNNNNAQNLSTNLQTKVTEINSNKMKIGADVSTKLNKKELTNADYTIDTDTPTQSDIYNELNDFASTSNSILDTLISIDKLIYGSTGSDNDNLQKTMEKFIDNRTIENMLKLIASTQFQNTDSSNTAFQTIINSYNVIYNSLKSSSWVNSKDILNNKDAQLELKLKALQNAYRPAYELLKWMQDKGNQAFLFNYLTDNNEANAREIKPKAATLYEDVLEEINKLEQSSNASGKTELDITEATELLNKFEVFNILQNGDTNKKPYVTSKVHVYITRTNASLPWFPQFLQADTSIKKSKINLKFVYQKPTNGMDFFNDVENFDVEVKNVWMTFNTLSVLHISKDDLYKEGNDTEKNKKLWNEQILFDASKGGWNAKTFNANLAEIYSRASKFAADNNSLQFFFEDVSFTDENQYAKSLRGEIPTGFNGFNHKKNWLQLYKDINKNNIAKNNNIDYSASPSYLKFKVRIKDEGIELDGKKWKQGTFNGKKLNFWLQKDTEVKIDGDKVKTLIPFHIAIPLISDNGDPALLFAYYVNYIETDLNGKPTFRNAYDTNQSETKWYLLKPNQSIINKISGYGVMKNAEGLANKSEQEKKQAIPLLMLDDLFLGHNSKDNIIPKDNRFETRKVTKELTDPDIFKAFDKFDIYIKLRESEKK